MTQSAIQQEALTRAVSGHALTNYATIIAGFVAKGIPAGQILPRENVFTFNAWKALGRSVRKGEHGVKVCVWVPVTGKGTSTTTTTDITAESKGAKSSSAFTMPRSTTVFHVSQTEPIQAVN